MVEITDAMVDRALDVNIGLIPDIRERIRKQLDAALNPLPEPEIVVTREMADAGGAEYEMPLSEDSLEAALIVIRSFCDMAATRISLAPKRRIILPYPYKAQ